MPSFFIRLIDPADGREYFLRWSTVVDAPTTAGMSEEELREWYAQEYGRQGLLDLPSAIHAARTKGVASVGYRDLADVIAGNRAGEGATELTLEEIVEQYCRDRPEE